jgi:hypothetical protein
MPRFRVLMQWLEEGYVEVAAETDEQAVERATACPLPEEHWPCHRSAEVREDVVIELPEDDPASVAREL